MVTVAGPEMLNKESTKKRLDFEKAHQYGYSPILENDRKNIEEAKHEVH